MDFPACTEVWSAEVKGLHPSDTNATVLALYPDIHLKEKSGI